MSGTTQPGVAEQQRGVAVFVDELAALGVTHAVISPGSRSAPLALALAGADRIRCIPVIDERSAGFVALGVGKATRRPALAVTTSGTAAANLGPAIHEAREARIPLIALTADRPPELRGVGEGQTIDQVELFGSSAGFLSIDLPTSESEWRRTAREAVTLSVSSRPGPVQVNVALRPPLDRVEGLAPGPTASSPLKVGRGTGACEKALRVIQGAQRPVAVAGREEGLDGERLAQQCARLGVPVLADPLSGAFRAGSFVPHWDLLLGGAAGFPPSQPDLLIRSGDLPTSKGLRAWVAGLARAGIDVVQFDPEDSRRDPDRASTLISSFDAAITLESLDSLAIEEGWLETWLDAGSAARSILATIPRADGPIEEPWVARECAEGADRVLFCSASLPIRDLEAFADLTAESPRILSNRGANGIDGVISTAVGVALGSDSPTTVIIGDVAFVHDQGALTLLRDTGTPVTVVLVDNGGGGIFDLLPVATRADEDFTRFFTTPTRLDVQSLCAAWSIDYAPADSIGELRALLGTQAGRPRVIHVPVDRAEGHTAREHARQAVAAALAG